MAKANKREPDGLSAGEMIDAAGAAPSDPPPASASVDSVSSVVEPPPAAEPLPVAPGPVAAESVAAKKPDPDVIALITNAIAELEREIAELGDPVARMRAVGDEYARAVEEKRAVVRAADEKITQAMQRRRAAENQCNAVEVPRLNALRTQLTKARAKLARASGG